MAKWNIHLLFTVFLLLPCMLKADPPVKGKTLALVVGISEYKDPGIKDLQYADKDAMAFAQYLKTRKSPADSIRLLTNEKATLAAINDGIDWLYKSAQPEDLIFIYFACHGDVEKQTPWQLGYLLAYDTPFNNYRNFAVRVEDINDMVLTLSSFKDARVVLITDACRSGKLAGSGARGSSLTTEALEKQANNEVRITACKSDQESQEGAWGGGHGVFSYYLINGLMGLADQENNREVTLEELRYYVKPQVSRDVREYVIGKTQDPVFSGEENFRMGIVDDKALAVLREQLAPGMAANGVSMGRSIEMALPEPDGLNPMEVFFTSLEGSGFITNLDFQEVAPQGKQAVLDYFLQTVESDSSYLPPPYKEKERAACRAYQQQLTAPDHDAGWQLALEHHLAIALHNAGQNIIVKYIQGDTAEINKRAYYNSQTANYDRYPALFEAALQLLEPAHPLYFPLQVKQHYFAGVAARLKSKKSVTQPCCWNRLRRKSANPLHLTTKLPTATTKWG
ncbi:MAG: caspase family protein [Lewinellaceae bacterium]|nr:caspase family protein [Lewinellaceae bacterium]